MKSNYSRIGEHIQLVDERNRELSIKTLLGLSIDKIFIPSVANTVGSDMANYKVIRKGQFACSLMQVRRDKKIPVAMLKHFDEAIISQAYPVFEIKDSNILSPEFLMMWMSRSEFDREACFYAVGGVRGSLEWDDFCNMELPVPSIEKQREIVREYYTIVDRIKLNEQLNQKLEETAQAIYKQWFVDFEFPISEEYATQIGKPELKGKPYKSSGGKMVWNDELEKNIPEIWGAGTLESFSELIDGDRGKNYPSQGDFTETGHCLFLNTGNVTKTGFDFTATSFITKDKDHSLGKGKLKRYDSILTTRGTVGNCAYYSGEIEYEDIRINSGMIIIRPFCRAKYQIYVYQLLNSFVMKNSILSFLSGSAQPQLPIKDLRRISVLKPTDSYIEKAMLLIEPIQKNIDGNNKSIMTLKELLFLLLAKMAKTF